ncbi:MAG TPA: lysylphosphatidylglycerol synthase domain-containing protein, partial [Miltoncostaeaceae bacterium]|nr:lysylphosphatidylglycerol synthase domain-containing protein [Miltoncostaeaceae bacterium]
MSLVPMEQTPVIASPAAAASPIGPRRTARRLLIGVGALALVALAVLGLSRVDLSAAAGTLADADPRMLLVAIGLYALGQSLSGAMWAVCQRSGGVDRLSLSTSLGLHWIARAACELLPASLGEVVRVALVRRHPAGRPAGTLRITGALADYKVIDAAVTVAVVIALVAAVPPPGPAAGLRWTAAVAAALIVVGVVLWRLGAGRRAARFVPGRLRATGARMGEGAAVLGHRRHARAAAVLGLGAALARLASLAALLSAIGAPAQAAGLTFCVTVLAGILPAAPGGAGMRELALIPALAVGYGVSPATGLAFSVAIQAAALLTSLVVDAGALAWLGP